MRRLLAEGGEAVTTTGAEQQPEPPTESQSGVTTAPTTGRNPAHAGVGPAHHLNHHQIKPGEVRNPSGRPKIVREVALLARQYTVKAVRTLAEIMQNKKAHAGARVRAAELLLERGYGKTPQVLNVVQHMGSEELERAARDILEKRAKALEAKTIEAKLDEPK